MRVLLVVLFGLSLVACGGASVSPQPSAGAPFVTQASQEKGAYGIAFYKDAQGWYVGYVLPGSDAERAGYRVGDRVRTLDDQVVDASFDMASLGAGEFRQAVVTTDRAGSVTSRALLVGGHATDCQTGQMDMKATPYSLPTCDDKGMCLTCCHSTISAPMMCTYNWTGVTDCDDTGTCTLIGSTCSSY